MKRSEFDKFEFCLGYFKISLESLFDRLVFCEKVERSFSKLKLSKISFSNVSEEEIFLKFDFSEVKFWLKLDLSNLEGVNV